MYLAALDPLCTCRQKCFKSEIDKVAHGISAGSRCFKGYDINLSRN